MGCGIVPAAPFILRRVPPEQTAEIDGRPATTHAAAMGDIAPRFDFAALAGGPEPMVLLVLVLAADALLGNLNLLRRWLPHPALLLALTVNGLERRLNRGGRSAVKRLVRGVLALILVLALALGVSWLVILISAALPFG
ncbi:MAG: hypothetical protein QF546_13785 [Alphaproteobacteria bacterium]|nr:hypothetical protein [Alphaproteobacteria bacterium]